MSTKKVAAEIAAFEKKNPNARGIPRELKAKYQRYARLEREEKRTPITWKGRQASIESYGTRGAKPGADPWKVVYADQRTKKSNTNRAQRASQKITLQDYRDYAARNNYPQSKADELFARNEQKLQAIQKGRGRFQNLRRNPVNFIYEHLTPQAGKKYGGVEHYRNITLLDERRNSIKSDKMPSKDAIKAAGIPLNKQSAIQMDFADKPVLPAKQRRQIILDDLAKPGRETARTVNSRIASKIAKQTAANVAARAASRAGRYLPGPLGTAFDVIDSAERISRAARPGANLLDKAQAGISVAATGLGTTGVGDVIGMPLQLLNDGIDAGRGLFGALTKQPSKAPTRGRNLLRRRP